MWARVLSQAILLDTPLDYEVMYYLVKLLCVDHGASFCEAIGNSDLEGNMLPSEVTWMNLSLGTHLIGSSRLRHSAMQQMIKIRN